MAGRTLSNQLVSIGEMRELVQFVTETYTLDGVGGKVPTLTAGTAVRAKVTFAFGSEAEQGTKQEKGTTDIKVICRYQSTIGYEHQILWDGDYYDITGVEHTAGKRFSVFKARLHEEA
jgi:head-tail adaptor